ncbi:hypothetical protein [Pseudomonas phage vB_Pa-PAC2]
MYSLCIHAFYYYFTTKYFQSQILAYKPTDKYIKEIIYRG